MLGCLVASMTLGAAVLDWGQPDRPPSQRRALELIAQGSTMRQWDSIRVDPKHDVSLSAKDAHFIVDAQGNCAATENWRGQRPLDRMPQIRIGLQAPLNSNQVTVSQWNGARELIDELQRVCKISRTVVDDTIALPASAPAPRPQQGRPTPSAGRLRR